MCPIVPAPQTLGQGGAESPRQGTHHPQLPSKACWSWMVLQGPLEGGSRSGEDRALHDPVKNSKAPLSH